jgi:hypothetical protein
MKPSLRCGTHSVVCARSPRRHFSNKALAGRRIDCPQVAGFVVDLDPTHRVLRITVTTALTDEAARDIYKAVARLASQGGPYAAITDFSRVVDFPISANTIRDLAACTPPIPLGGRPSVMVARQPALFGLARMFEMHREAMGLQLQVVHSIDEAYDLLKVTPQDFSERLYPKDVAV